MTFLASARYFHWKREWVSEQVNVCEIERERVSV